MSYTWRLCSILVTGASKKRAGEPSIIGRRFWENGPTAGAG